MTASVYQVPMRLAIRDFTLVQLVQAFGSGHPAFFAAVLRSAGHPPSLINRLLLFPESASRLSVISVIEIQNRISLLQK